jgi:hypothetical protein
VDHYNKNCQNLQYSYDAQYFIEKNGGSLLLDVIAEMKNPTNVISYNKIV